MGDVRPLRAPLKMEEACVCVESTPLDLRGCTEADADTQNLSQGLHPFPP